MKCNLVVNRNDCIVTKLFVDDEQEDVAEKHEEFRKTYHNRASTSFSIHMLVAQVEDKCCSAVKKGQYSNADVKLC